MSAKFVNVTTENIAEEHLCCIIRSRKPHQGVEAKRDWLAKRLSEGHVFRKLDVKGVVFIEYAPLESAWVPINANNYYYIYCLWVEGREYKGKGYGKELLEYCIEDALAHGKSGICMLGAKKQKHWLSDQSFAKKHGFAVVDTTDNGYELLARSFDGTKPTFTQNAKRATIEEQELTLYYDVQCPHTFTAVENIKQYCVTNNIEVNINVVDTLEKAKQLPCVFNNYAIFYKGRFETVNLVLDTNSLEKILKR